jgi:hypothetical protein
MSLSIANNPMARAAPTLLARASKSGDNPAANEQKRKGAANRREGKSCVAGVGGD